MDSIDYIVNAKHYAEREGAQSVRARILKMREKKHKQHGVVMQVNGIDAPSGTAVKARIWQGQWIADCECGGAEFVFVDEPIFYCFGCGNRANANGVRPVEVCYHYDAMIADRSKGALRMELRTALPGDPTYAPGLARYARPYPGTVRAQSADGTLAIACDDPSVGDGLQSIPLRVGLPGCAVTVPEGTRVRVRFENADPRGCYAGGDIDQDPAATKALALKDDKSVCGSLSATVIVTALGMSPIPIDFTYAGPFGNQGPGTSVNLEGKIDSPCHAYAKGVPA